MYNINLVIFKSNNSSHFHVVFPFHWAIGIWFARVTNMKERKEEEGEKKSKPFDQ